MAEPAASASAPKRAPITWSAPLSSIPSASAPTLAASGSGSQRPAPRPVEVGPASPDAIVASLANSGPTRVVTLQVELAPADATRLEAKLAELHQRAGGRAYLVLVPPGVDVEHYAIAPLYERLGLAKRDVLILANGQVRHLRTAGLPKEAGGEILKATREAYQRSPVDGMLAVVDELERRFAAAAPATTASATHATPPPEGRPAGVPLPLVVLGVMVLALIVVALLRRRSAPGNAKKGERTR